MKQWVVIFFWFSLILRMVSISAFAAKIEGNTDFGFVFLTNNLADKIEDDQVGLSYAEPHYTMMSWGLRLNAWELLNPDVSHKDIRAHVRARWLWNVENHNDAFMISDKFRHQVEEACLEFESLMSGTDLWIGRQLIFEANAVGLDGLRVVSPIGKDMVLGFFGGFGVHPRSMTGYLGSSYDGGVFTTDFPVGGMYGSYRSSDVKLDMAITSEMFHSKVDRLSFFSHLVYQVNSEWALSGLLNIGLAGDKGIKSLQAFAITRPHYRVRNTFSFSRYEPLVYHASLSSGIQTPEGIDTSMIGQNTVYTSSYHIIRDHLIIRLQKRSHVFGAINFSHRTFDDRTQLKYSLGYRNQQLFGSTFDLETQGHVFSNYRGFHAGVSVLLGKTFMNEQLRLESQGTWLSAQRDRFIGIEKIRSEWQTDQEYTLRFSGIYYWSDPVSLQLHYTLYDEVDTSDKSSEVMTHEVFVNTKIRF